MSAGGLCVDPGASLNGEAHPVDHGESCDADIRGSQAKETHCRIHHLAFLSSHPSGNEGQDLLPAKMI